MAAEVTTIQLDDGSIVGPANPMPMNGANVFNTDVTVHDPNTVGNKLAVDALGRVTVASARSMTTGQGATGLLGAATKLLDQDAARAFVRVFNLSSHTVFIGTSGAVVITNGTALAAGTYQDFPIQSEVWVCSAQANDKVTWAYFTT